jgi:NitT/TauT family transport system substrate-binding protein
MSKSAPNRCSRRAWLAAGAAFTVLPQTGRAQAFPAVRFATSQAEGYMQPFFAQDAGMFAKAGLSVEITQLASGAAVSTALAGGAIDVGIGTIVNIANAIARSVPFVLIAPASLETPNAPAGLLCVLKTASIASAKDLEGKTVAVPALKQIVDLGLEVWLAKGGADPKKVQVVESSFADMGAGIERGTFAAAVISEPALYAAMSRNTLRVIGDPYGAIAPTYAIAGWITTTGYQQKNPEVVRRVAGALMDAARWANTHHDETAPIVARITKVDVETIRREVRPVYSDALRAAELQPQLDAALKYGYISRAMTANELIGRS